MDVFGLAVRSRHAITKRYVDDQIDGVVKRMKRDDKTAETLIKESELDALERKLSTRFGERETKLKDFVKSELQASMSAHENKVRSETPKILETNVEKVLRHALDEHVKDVKRRFVEHETSLKDFVKSELQTTMSAHERKVPSNLLETLPLVGSSGNFNFHDKLIRKVGPGTNSSDVVIKAQLDGTLAEAKKHAESLFHVHKELVKNDYSNLETKLEKLEKVDVKKVVQEDIDKRTASLDKAMTTRLNALREEVDKRIKVCEEKLTKLETDYSLLDVRLTSVHDKLIIPITDKPISSTADPPKPPLTTFIRRGGRFKTCSVLREAKFK